MMSQVDYNAKPAAAVDCTQVVGTFQSLQATGEGWQVISRQARTNCKYLTDKGRFLGVAKYRKRPLNKPVVLQ